MKRLVDKGHAERVPVGEVVRRPAHTWYIPQHPVFKPNKPSKIRVVFDCAASFQGSTLNREVGTGSGPNEQISGSFVAF